MLWFDASAIVNLQTAFFLILNAVSMFLKFGCAGALKTSNERGI